MEDRMFHQNVVMRQTPWFLFWQKLRETEKKHTQNTDKLWMYVWARGRVRGLWAVTLLYMCVWASCSVFDCAVRWLADGWVLLELSFTLLPPFSLSALPCSFCALNLEGSVHRSCLLKPRGKTFNCLCTLVGRLWCSFQCSNFYFF